MILKAKLRKIGNSLGIIIPKEVITYIEEKWLVNVITEGDCLYFKVIIDDSKLIDCQEGVITEQTDQTEKSGSFESIIKT